MNNNAIITLEEGCAVTIVRGGVKVAFNANGGIKVYGNTPVTLHPPANGEPQIGDVMADGTVYAGISPATDEALYVAAQDAPATMKWKAAMKYAADLDANGHKDWRLPSKAEMDLLYRNKDAGALKGTFKDKVSGFGLALWYWSCTEHASNSSGAWGQCFTDGGGAWDNSKGLPVLSVRCVRAEPRPAAGACR